jgi:hypothetical protein
MPTSSQSRNTFRRHVAPFAPLALALAMNGVNTGPTGNLPTQQATVQKGSFTPICGLPFPGIRNPAADDHCGLQGGSADPAKQAESGSKNDFCEARQAPQVVSYQELVNLQAQSANIPKNIPDRKVVESLGEGKYVSYVAFVKDAHYSDVTAGEAVNCNIPGNESNDIHIVLMPSTTDGDECHSTTAEMSPHYRPPSWTPDNIVKASAGHPIRVQGHLFYDGSHTPCSGSSRPNPKRASLWEVHPVYSFEVCAQTTITECQSGSAEWTPLEKVFASEPTQ